MRREEASAPSRVVKVLEMYDYFARRRRALVAAAQRARSDFRFTIRS